MQQGRRPARPLFAHTTALCGIALFVAALLVSRVAVATPMSTWLEIERAPGSEQCADVDAVFAAITALFPEREIQRSHDASKLSAKASITVRPTSLGHEALIRVVLPRSGERSLLVKQRDCSGLAEALAVTLVMLLDNPPTTAAAASPAKIGPMDTPAPSEATLSVVTTPRQNIKVETTPARPQISTAFGPRISAQYPVSPQSRPARPRAPDSARAPLPSLAASDPNAPTNHASRWSAELFAAPNASYGLLSRPALGPALGATFGHRNGYGFTLQGLRLWSLAVDRTPGSMSLSLWGVMFGPCAHSELATRTRLDVCLQCGLGQQRADSKGYRRPGHAVAPWVVAGSSASLTRELARALRGFVTLGFVGQLQRESFSVEGISGPVAPAPRFGLWVEMGLSLKGGLF